ncbi:GntR family transcriptional regulator [Nocardioides sp. DS6]|uniref:GntR family transcriptional regulator n=1 Tax=Nocardioides eburneus TaxID=3231482 RepID=A0ABV3T0K8_9ACTN
MEVGAERLASPAEVADAVRRGILAGELVAGQRLVEAELSESLGARRGAVRTALIDLTHEGLVERIANRGARVRVVSVEEAIQITEVRMMVEGLCGAKAAERISDDEIADLQALGDRMRACVDHGDVVGYSRLNQQLHETVIRIAAQPVAAEVIGQLRARNVRHQFRLAYRPGRPQASLPQHLAIIEGLAARDPEAAQAAVRAHIASVMTALRESDPA